MADERRAALPGAVSRVAKLAEGRRERERGREREITSYHGQLLSLAVQWGVAIEIERAIKKNASF